MEIQSLQAIVHIESKCLCQTLDDKSCRIGIVNYHIILFHSFDCTLFLLL